MREKTRQKLRCHCWRDFLSKQRADFLRLFFFCMLLTFSSGCQSFTVHCGDESRAPQDVVEAYVKADAEGATLSSEKYASSVIPSIVLSSQYETPGWDTVSIVERSEVIGIEPMEDAYDIQKVKVQYHIIADCADELMPKAYFESYSFRVHKMGNKWMIVNPTDLRPHVSLPAFLRHVHVLLRADPERKGLETMLLAAESLKSDVDSDDKAY